jgi:hypothetical protein
MRRITLTDGSGRWFDAAAAERFEEELNWNGSNMISAATRRRWEHERLYRTAGGRWVLRHWSQWQGVPESWTEIDDEQAAAWLATNGHDPHPACAAEYAGLEVR